MDNLNINSQFIGCQQTHRKRVLHRIDLHEDYEEHVLKIKEREESI